LDSFADSSKILFKDQGFIMNSTIDSIYLSLHVAPCGEDILIKQATPSPSLAGVDIPLETIKKLFVTSDRFLRLCQEGLRPVLPLFIPIRTRQLSDLAKDLFFPVTVNFVLKIQGTVCKVVTFVIALFLDLLTLSIRLLTLLPRIYANKVAYDRHPITQVIQYEQDQLVTKRRVKRQEATQLSKRLGYHQQKEASQAAVTPGERGTYLSVIEATVRNRFNRGTKATSPLTELINLEHVVLIAVKQKYSHAPSTPIRKKGIERSRAQLEVSPQRCISFEKLQQSAVYLTGLASGQSFQITRTNRKDKTRVRVRVEPTNIGIAIEEHLVTRVPMPPHLQLPPKNSFTCRQLGEATEFNLGVEITQRPQFQYPSLRTVLKDLFRYAWGYPLEDCSRPIVCWKKKTTSAVSSRLTTPNQKSSEVSA
jgi:hypothetical protein